LPDLQLSRLYHIKNGRPVMETIALTGAWTDATAALAAHYGARMASIGRPSEHLMRRLGRVVPKAVLEEELYGHDDEHRFQRRFRPRAPPEAQARRCPSHS
jgi:hypothetical protein